MTKDHKRRDTAEEKLNVINARLREELEELKAVNARLEAEILERKRSEEAMKKGRQRLHDVLDMLPAYVVLLTPDYHVPFINRFFRERFGESAGRRCFEWLFERTEPCEICETYTALKTNAPHRWEWTGPDRRDYDIFDFPFTDRGGSRLIMEVGIDITELKQAHESLKEANETLEQRVAQRTAELASARNEAISERNRLEAVMKALPVAMTILDERGGNILSNHMFEQLWGSPRPHAKNVSDYEAYKAWWVDTGEPVRPEEWASARAAQKGETVIGQLMEIESFDGVQKFIMNSAAPFHDSEGKIIGSAVAIQDITDIKRAEREVLNHAAELEAVFAAQDDAVLMYDTEMNVKQANPAFLSKYSFDPVGLNVREIIQRVSCRWLDGRPFLLEEQPTPRALRGEKASGQCFAITRPDGTDAVVETSARPMLLGDRVTGSVTVWHDITELKRTEKDLKESEERFRLLSETAGRLLASEDPKSLVDELCREVMVNLDCQAFFNFLADEQAGRLHLNACAGIPNEEARKIEWLDYGVAVCGCVALDGEQIVAEDIFNSLDLRTELVKSYGIQAYACHPLKAKDRTIGTLSFGTKTRARFSTEDLALMKTVADQVVVAMERIKLIEELQRSRDELELRVYERTEELRTAYDTLRSREEDISKARFMLQIIFDGISDPLFMVDKNLGVRMLNRASCSYFQVSDIEEAIGKTCYQLLGDRCLPCDRCEISLAVSDGKTATFDRKGPLAPERVEQITIYPVDEAASGFYGAIIRISDITESRNLEKHIMHVDRLSSLGQLSGGIAHEIRNPLAAINLFLDVLSDEERFKRTGQELDILKEIKGNVMRIEGIVKRVLDFSRQSESIPHSKIEVARLIEESLKLWRSVMVKNGLESKLFIEDDLPGILGDPIEIQQVLNNLLQNAIEAMSRGGVLTVAARKELFQGDKTRQAVITSIQDTGSGIPVELQKSIFNPFFTTKPTGTGLGLAISHRIISRHGGIISFESKPGVGTTFCIELPAAP